MAAFYGKTFYGAGFPVKGLLLLWRRRGRLYRYTENKFIAVGDATHYPARMVGQCFAGFIFDGIVVLHPKHTGSPETGAELDTADGWYGKYRMADKRFHGIKKRFAQSYRKAIHPAFHDTADRV